MTRSVLRGVIATPPATIAAATLVGARARFAPPCARPSRGRPRARARSRARRRSWSRAGSPCRRRSCRPADSRRWPRSSASASPASRTPACRGRRRPRSASRPAAPARTRRRTRRFAPGFPGASSRTAGCRAAPAVIVSPTCSVRFVTGVFCRWLLNSRTPTTTAAIATAISGRATKNARRALGSDDHAVSRLPVGGLATTLALRPVRAPGHDLGSDSRVRGLDLGGLGHRDRGACAAARSHCPGRR